MTEQYLPHDVARMAWGSSQEATAVLVAVNYFQAHGLTGVDSNGEQTHTMVEEAGKRAFCYYHVSHSDIMK